MSGIRDRGHGSILRGQTRYRHRSRDSTVQNAQYGAEQGYSKSHAAYDAHCSPPFEFTPSTLARGGCHRCTPTACQVVSGAICVSGLQSSIRPRCAVLLPRALMESEDRRPITRTSFALGQYLGFARSRSPCFAITSSSPSQSLPDPTRVTAIFVQEVSRFDSDHRTFA